MNYKYRFFALFISVCCWQTVVAQVIVSGATCVTANTPYQYIVSGNVDSGFETQVCITRGIIFNNPDSSTCTTVYGSVNSVIVIWNDSLISTSSLTASFSDRDTSMDVYFAASLTAGLIDSASKSQIINEGTIPAEIICGADSGGSCAPFYNYQWQTSLNTTSWTDIEEATSANLKIDHSLEQTTFYRRKVTEISSGSVAYSDVASILVILQRTDSTDVTSVENGKLHEKRSDFRLQANFQEKSGDGYAWLAFQNHELLNNAMTTLLTDKNLKTTKL